MRVLLLLLLLAGCVEEDGITVGAAASLERVVIEIAREHEAATGVPVRPVFASSGRVAQQLRAGASYDVVVLASPALMDNLQRDGLLDASTRRDVAGNTLVVVRGPGVSRHVVADPATVPLGHYTEQAVPPRPDTIYAASATQAAALVARGEAATGVIYATDVVPPLTIVERVDPERHDPITYPAATATRAGAGARAFVDRLTGHKTFARHGFTEPTR